MASPLSDIPRALSSLAILPDIGRHIAGMRKDVKRMADAVEALPAEIVGLREEVASLHVDMKTMVDDVHELKAIDAKLDELNERLGRIPFVRRRGQQQAPATEPPEAA
jgi:regulator of replication initiation timing